MSENDYDRLIGKTVDTVEVSDDESELRFRFADGSSVLWVTEGDCCSQSWWSDIYELGALQGGTVQAVESIELADYGDPDTDGRSRQEYDQVYGYRVRTDKGEATLAFRNSSNGYYGGWAFIAEDKGTRPGQYGDSYPVPVSGQFRLLSGSEWQA